IYGDTINTSSRVCSAAAPGEVLVTTRFADKVRGVEGAAEAFALSCKGKFELKGKGLVELHQASERPR
ncbi:hypothetical protein T484DRAFT_1860962, partial [Baffinella frigidus]